jgi:hypothetical protein
MLLLFAWTAALLGAFHALALSLLRTLQRKAFLFSGMREGVTMLSGEGKDRGTPSQNQAKPVGSPPHHCMEHRNKSLLLLLEFSWS